MGAAHEIQTTGWETGSRSYDAITLRHVDLPPTVPVQSAIPVEILQTATFFEQAQARFLTLGNLQHLTDKDRLRDNAGKILPCNFLIETEDVHEAAKIAMELQMGIVMIGALSSATNNFTPPMGEAHDLRAILAIKPKGIINDAELKSTPQKDRIPNKSNQVSIDREKLTVTVGAGMTFAQVNKILKAELGPEYYAPVDLTTIDTALAGAVFATGAMGPSRIRINEITDSVNITDGTKIETVTAVPAGGESDEILNREGLIGLDGGVTEITLKIIKRPRYRFGISFALKDANGENWHQKAAELLGELYQFNNLRIECNEIKSDWKDGFIDGIEIITAENLRLLVELSTSKETRQQAKRLLQKMAEANSDYTIYLTGNTKIDTATFFEGESHNNDNGDDDNSSPTETPATKLIALFEADKTGAPTPYSQSDILEAMRRLREAIPDIARNQGRITSANEKTDLTFSTSTDINSHIDPKIAATLSPIELQSLFHTILEPYAQYQTDIEALSKEAATKGITVELYRYGHLHPKNLDPHMRVVAKTNLGNETEFEKVTAEIARLKDELLKAVMALPQKDNHIVVTHGEKGKIPNLKLLPQETVAMIRARLAKTSINWTFRTPRTAA